MVFINERSEAFNSSIDLSKGLTIGDIREIGKLGIDIMTGNREEVRSDNLLVFVEPSNKLDLSKFLDWRFVSCEMGLRKPDPEAFAYVVKDLNVDLQKDVVCFVDDSKTNVAAGNAAGMRSILFEGDSAECRTALIAEGFWELRV